MTKTLASLALLKVTWDTYQRDFLDVFVLLIVTLFNKKRFEYADLDNLTIREDFEAEFGLSIPYHPMITVLKRAKKRGYFKRSQRKYYPVWDNIERDDISEIAESQELKHKHVIDEFMQYCSKKFTETISEQDADKAFVSFLKDYDLQMLFATRQGSSVLPMVDKSEEHQFLMFSFIRHVIENNPLVFRFIVDISVGHLIANTMLLRGYSQLQGKMKNAKIYLDTGFLFGVTGANGMPMKAAYKEWVELAHSHGVSLFVFRHTYREFLTILENCLHFIESDYFDPRKASRSLLYFRDHGWSVSDVEEFILHVEESLATLKIQVISTPAPMEDVQYQIGETVLEDLIIEHYKERNPNFVEQEKEETIYRDVKSITYVYKLRKGHVPRSLAQVRHVFVTTNATLAYASREFEYQESGIRYHYIPAALTDVFLGTLLWTRSPSTAKINEKRLIALAYAASVPSKAFREELMNQAEQLRKRKEISEDDVILLTESRVARNLLQKQTLGNPDQLTYQKLLNVLETIRLEIREQESKAFDSSRSALEKRAMEAERLAHVKEKQSQRTLEVSQIQWRELLRIKGRLDDKAKKHVDSCLKISLFVYIALFILAVALTRIYSWDAVEPYLTLLGVFPPIAAYGYFVVKKKTFELEGIYEQLVASMEIKIYKDAGFDIAKFRELEKNLGKEL